MPTITMATSDQQLDLDELAAQRGYRRDRGRRGGSRDQAEARELPCRAPIWATATRIRSA